MEIDAEKISLRDALFSYGNLVVEAAPGTGKTFAGVFLAREACRNNWVVGRQRALLLTFSRNARIQIEDEIDRFITCKELSRDESYSIYASNYHSLYFELLQKKKGFWGISKIRPATPDEEKMRENAPEKVVEGIKNGTPRYKDFPALILQLLRNCPTLISWLHTTYPFVILDEFQDTDSPQWEILQLWKPKHIVIFYDRFQMIYDFRNANIDNVCKAIAEYQIPICAQMILTKIFRIDSQNTLGCYILELRKDELRGNQINITNLRPWLVIRPCGNTRDSRAFIRCATQIRYISHNIDFNESTAIITNTNDLAKSLQKSLSKKSSGANQWFCSCRLIVGKKNASDEIRDLLLKLRKCRNDKEIRGWIGLLFDNMLIANNLICFKKEFKKNKDNMLARRHGLLKEMREDYKLIFDNVKKENIKGIGALLNFILKYAKQYVLQQSTLDPDWYLFVRQFAKISNAATSIESWDTYCDALENEVLIQSHFKRKSTHGVTILNAHQSKGRQFDHVILPWLSENGESASTQIQGKKYDYNNDADKRLLYVALTRAKKRVTIIYPEESPAKILIKWKLIRI